MHTVRSPQGEPLGRAKRGFVIAPLDPVPDQRQLDAFPEPV